MLKKLSRIGNSLGVILDRPILELLQIDESTPLELITDGKVLILRPRRDDTDAASSEADSDKQ